MILVLEFLNRDHPARVASGSQSSGAGCCLSGGLPSAVSTTRPRMET